VTTRLDSALDLAQRGFYVFPIVENTKLPAIKDYPNRATRDADMIRAWWSSRDCNVGISTSRFGNNNALVVVDVDTKGGKNGEAALLELEILGMEFPSSLEQQTCSGGRHIIYVTEQPLRQGVDVLGKGLDIRSKGGYIVGPGSEIDGKPYRWIDISATPAEAPAWLVNKLGVRADVERLSVVLPDSVDPDRAWDRALDYLKIAPHAVEGQGGDEATYKVAARIKDFGCSQEQTYELLLDFWNGECTPPWSPDELLDKVANAYKYGTEQPGAAAPEAIFTEVAEAQADESQPPYAGFNRHYAFTVAGGGHIIWETTNADNCPMLQHLDINTFHLQHASRTLLAGNKATPLTKMWLNWDGRRSYDGFVFRPEQEAGPRWYNLWRGFSVEPAESADHPMVARFIDHCKENVCGGDEKLTQWLLGYFAHLVQRPWEKPLTALVFKGRKGTGKNALVERIGKLIGPHFLLTSKRRYLTSNFNGHFESCLCLVLDEAFWSGDKESEGVLKDLITGDHHIIEHKGKETYKIANLTRVCILGNEEWIVPATVDERRFAVFQMGEGRMQDRKYFQELREGLDDGGNRQLLRFLLDFDLSKIDVNEAPQTQALLDQKLATMEPMPKWWYDCLSEGDIAAGDLGGAWPSVVPAPRLRQAFELWTRRHNVRSRMPSDKDFGKLLKAIAPSIQHKKIHVQGSAKAYGYSMPTLAKARADWDAYIGHEEKWNEE
jgi:hypothetical protein